MVLGVIALIVVGPKELPVLLRTIGRYAGVLKRQADEFRAHFDQAMREAELDQLTKDVTGFKDQMEGAVRDAARTAEDEVRSAARSIDEPGEGVKAATLPEPDPDYHDENGLPLEPPKVVKTAADSTSASVKSGAVEP